jgi:hypothetical protein
LPSPAAGLLDGFAGLVLVQHRAHGELGGVWRSGKPAGRGVRAQRLGKRVLVVVPGDVAVPVPHDPRGVEPVGGLVEHFRDTGALDGQHVLCLRAGAVAVEREETAVPGMCPRRHRPAVPAMNFGQQRCPIPGGVGDAHQNPRAAPS